MGGNRKIPRSKGKTFDFHIKYEGKKDEKMNTLKKKTGCFVLAMMLLFNCFSATTVMASDDNLIQNAILISENGSYTGTASEDGVAYYRFDLQTSGKVTLELSVFQGSSAYLVLYNNEYEEIGDRRADYDGNRDCAHLKALLHLSAGTYYIKLSDLDKLATYEFTTSFEDAQESFPESQNNPNDILGQAKPISMGQYYQGLIGYDDDQDFYIFTVPFSGNVTFKHYNYTENTRGNYNILDQEGNQVREPYANYDSNKGYAYGVDTFWLDQGTYYLKAYGYNGFYKFSINIKPETGSVDSATRSRSAATLSLKKCDGVSGYVIQYSTSEKFGKRRTKTITSTSTRLNLRGLKPKKTYYIRVKCYKQCDGKTYYGAYGDTYQI